MASSSAEALGGEAAITRLPYWDGTFSMSKRSRKQINGKKEWPNSFEERASTVWVRASKREDSRVLPRGNGKCGK